MADLDLKIIIQAQVDKAKKAIEDLKGKLSGAGKAANGMGSEGSAGAGRFTRAMDKVRNGTERTKASLQGAVATARNFWGTIAGVVTGTVIGGIIRINASFQKLHASLVTVTGSAANADQAFADIKEFARTTPFQVEEITGAFIKLKALGLEPSMEALRSYGNTASAMGKSLDQFVEAVADAAVGEFERLKEFGIKASSEGNRVKFTFQGVTTEVGKNAREIEQYLRSLGDVHFAGAMERQMNTIGGAFSNLKDTIADVSSAIGEAGLNRVIVEMLQKAAAGIAQYKDEIADGVQAIVRIFTGAASSIRAGFNVLTAVFGSVATAVSWLAEQILRALSAVTFGDLSKGYAKMADDMQRVTKALKKGVLTDLEDIKSAVGDISAAVDGTEVKKRAEEAEKQTDAQRRANQEKKALDEIRKHDAAEAAAAQKTILEAETKQLKAELKKREQEYKRHLNELKKVQAERKSIQEEFDKAVEEITSDGKEEGPSHIFDAVDIQGRAVQQINAGDFDAAIASARQGIELLRKLKDEGNTSKAALWDMANIFKDLANTASKGKEDTKIIETDKAKTDIDELKAKIDGLIALVKGKPIELKVNVDTSTVVAQVQQAVAEAQAAAHPIVIKTVTAVGTTSYSDGTDYQDVSDIISREVIAGGSR